MVLDTFAETKVSRRAGAKPGIKINPKTILYLDRKFVGSERGDSNSPYPLLRQEASAHKPPYKRGGEERQFFIKAEVLQDKASKVEA